MLKLSEEKPKRFYPERVTKLIDRVAFSWAVHALAYVEAQQEERNVQHPDGVLSDASASAVVMHELERLLRWSPEQMRQYVLKRKLEEWD